MRTTPIGQQPQEDCPAMTELSLKHHTKRESRFEVLSTSVVAISGRFFVVFHGYIEIKTFIILLKLANP